MGTPEMDEPGPDWKKIASIANRQGPAPSFLLHSGTGESLWGGHGVSGNRQAGIRCNAIMTGTASWCHQEDPLLARKTRWQGLKNPWHGEVCPVNPVRPGAAPEAGFSRLDRSARSVRPHL